jgi:hypothetical protein
MKSPKAKSPKKPFRIQRFGAVTALMFDDGGYAEVSMQALELKRLMEALQRYAVRAKKIPSPKLLNAIDVVHEFLDSPAAMDLSIEAEVVMGFRGVRLSVIDVDLPGTP